MYWEHTQWNSNELDSKADTGFVRVQFKLILWLLLLLGVKAMFEWREKNPSSMWELIAGYKQYLE